MISTAAIVLAAGSSSRLGQPKQLLPHANGSLVGNAVAAARGVDCDPIIVVTGAIDEPIRELLKGQATVMPNANWPAGMGGSISAGVDAVLNMQPETLRLMVLLCDQPKLNATVLRILLTRWQLSGRSMAACRYGNALGPPCGFDRTHFKALQTMPADRGAKFLFWPIESVATVDWPDGAIDIDTPEDLRRWNGIA